MEQNTEVAFRDAYFDRFNAKDITILHIIQFMVAITFDMDPDDMMKRHSNGKLKKDSAIAIPRFISIGLSRLWTEKEKFSLKTIGDYYGGVNHATVLYHAGNIDITWINDWQYGERTREIIAKLEDNIHYSMLNEVLESKKPKLPKSMRVYIPAHAVEWSLLDKVYAMHNLPGMGFIPIFTNEEDLKELFGEDSQVLMLTAEIVNGLQREKYNRRDDPSD